jgi:hypothetical protein
MEDLRIFLSGLIIGLFSLPLYISISSYVEVRRRRRLERGWHDERR